MQFCTNFEYISPFSPCISQKTHKWVSGNSYKWERIKATIHSRWTLTNVLFKVARSLYCTGSVRKLFSHKVWSCFPATLSVNHIRTNIITDFWSLACNSTFSIILGKCLCLICAIKFLFFWLMDNHDASLQFQRLFRLNSFRGENLNFKKANTGNIGRPPEFTHLWVVKI